MSVLLGRVGLLDGRRATTHWRSPGWMRESFPTVTVEEKYPAPTTTRAASSPSNCPSSRGLLTYLKDIRGLDGRPLFGGARL